MKEPMLKDSVEEFASTAKEYINLKMDEYKLRGVESLATLLNTLIFMIAATILAGVVIQLFALALGWWIGAMVGSVAVGLLIDGGIFVLIFLFLYLRRDSLFIDPMVKLCIKLFFDNDDKDK